MSQLTHEDNNRAFIELKNTLEKRNQELSETKERLEKVESDLDSFEKINQKNYADLQEKANFQKELKDKIEALEKQLYRMPTGSSKTESVEYTEMKKALDTFFRKDL